MATGVDECMDRQEQEVESHGNQFDVDDFISFADNLIFRCGQLKGVQGSGKLERKLKAEAKFLKQVSGFF